MKDRIWKNPVFLKRLEAALGTIFRLCPPDLLPELYVTF